MGEETNELMDIAAGKLNHILFSKNVSNFHLSYTYEKNYSGLEKRAIIKINVSIPWKLSQGSFSTSYSVSDPDPNVLIEKTLEWWDKEIKTLITFNEITK